MMRLTVILPFLLLAASGAAQSPRGSYTVRPLIGTGERGDGGPSVQAPLDGPYGLAEDARGNIYISESNAGIIRRVRPDGVIERFAGTGTLADGAEGKPALQTDLLYPTVMVFDRDGGLVFADPRACRIRKVLTDGTIRNLIGTGQCATAGGGGIFGGGLRDRRALETDVASVGAMVLDGAGQLVFSDETNNVIRRLESDGFVRTMAGLGYAGFGGDTGPATSAAFSAPRGLAWDAAANLYVADSGNCRVRRIASDGVVDTVAGTGTVPGTGGCATASQNFAGGAATRIAIGRLSGLAYDRDTDSLIIGSPSQARVLRLELAGARITSFLGNGRRGATDTRSAAEYGVDEPAAILASSRAGILVADVTSYAVLGVRGDAVTPFAGAWPQLAAYPSAASAPLLRPRGLCVDPDGSLLVVDAGAERVLRFRHPDQLAAFAGARHPMGYTGGDNGPALQAFLNAPARVACAPNGEVYVVHGRQIRAINREGVIRTVRDFLDDPAGLVLDAEGRLIYSEAGAHRVVRYDPVSRATTVLAGSGTSGFSGDGGPATDARLNSPGDVALDSQRNLLIADRGNRRVRRVSPAGVIQTVAGSARSFSYLDTSGQLATAIGLDRPDGLAVDAGDNIYISESSRLNVVRTDGRIYVLSGYIGEDDNGNKFYLDGPRNGCDGIAIDRQGRIYFSLRNGSRVMVAETLSVSEGGVVSSSAFGGFRSIAPGSWIEIYGASLAAAARQWTGADFNGSQAPTSLDGTRVTIGGQAAFVAYISPGQVNAQVPSNVSTGQQQLTVTTPAGTSAPYSVTINATQPGLLAPPSFKIGERQYVVAALAGGGGFALPSGVIAGARPARPGETVTLYGIGFGPVTPRVDAGTVAQGSTALGLPVQFSFGSTPAAVSYAGLAPGSIGLYQFNVVVPNVAGDAIPLTFTLGGAPGQQVLFTAVQN